MIGGGLEKCLDTNAQDALNGAGEQMENTRARKTFVQSVAD